MRILDIIEGTSVDGPGLRTAIYLPDAFINAPDVIILNHGLWMPAKRSQLNA